MKATLQAVEAQAAIADFDGTERCRGPWWTEQERRHARAKTPDAARAAAEPALAACDGCPSRAKCTAWAGYDDYTGLAAGHVYVNGVPYPADKVIRRRRRRKKPKPRKKTARQKKTPQNRRTERSSR